MMTSPPMKRSNPNPMRRYLLHSGYELKTNANPVVAVGLCKGILKHGAFNIVILSTYWDNQNDPCRCA
jgi:hypothetical protein